MGSLATGEADLTDVQADVSSRRLRVWREGGAWWAMGLGSTNGSWLTPAGGERVCLESGVCRQVQPADELTLGAGTSFVLVKGAVGLECRHKPAWPPGAGCLVAARPI